MGLFGKKEIKNRVEFNTVHVHILEETVRGDLLKIGQFKKRISRNNEDKSIFVKIFGERISFQPNELLHRADGSKDFFLLREGVGVFKPLTMFHYNTEYFEKNSDNEMLTDLKVLKNRAIYLRTMNVNEKQVYKNTLKGIYARGLGFWDKHGPALLMIMIFVIGVGALIFITKEMTTINATNTGALTEIGRNLADAINGSYQQQIIPITPS